MEILSPAPVQTPVGAVAIVTPRSDTKDNNCWYAFYSKSQQREYYYNPETGMSNWVLPAGTRRLTTPRMNETYLNLVPAIPHFSFDLFDDDDACAEDEDSETGPWREKSVLKANLIVLGIFFVGMLFAVACWALNVVGILAIASSKLDSIQENVARRKAMNMQSEVQRRNEIKSALYYPSWVHVANDPLQVFSMEELNNPAASEQSEDHADQVNHAFYYPSWWSVLENVNESPRGEKLDQLVHNLVASLETADVLLSKIVIDAQEAGMELGA